MPPPDQELPPQFAALVVRVSKLEEALELLATEYHHHHHQYPNCNLMYEHEELDTNQKTVDGPLLD